MKKQFSIFRLSTILLLAAVVSFSSCKKEVDATFTKDFANIAFTVDSTSAYGEQDLLQKDITTNIAELAAANGFDISDIKSAKITKCNITIKDLDPNPVTFDVVDNVNATLIADGVSPLVIGEKTITKTAATQVDLDLKEVDVMPYIKATKYSLKLHGKTNAPIPHEVPMEATITFQITATVLK